MNQYELYLLGRKKLDENMIIDANLKAKRLLEFVFHQNRMQCIENRLKEVDTLQKEFFLQSIQKIIEGTPIQYITHLQEFMGIEFYVDENVLIPQPDTEILVEATIQRLKEKNKKQTNQLGEHRSKQQNKQQQYEQQNKTQNDLKILDLCTGSGAIGISIAKYVKNVNVTMTDISTQALNIAKKNAMQNGVEGKVTLLLSNLWEEIPKIKFDCIVSNPPYIETSVIEKLSNEVKSEPRIALDGGNDGLFFYKEILKNAFQFLKPEGYLLLEIGYDQGKKVIDLWKEKNTVLELITKDPIKDFANNDRVIIFKKIKQ